MTRAAGESSVSCSADGSGAQSRATPENACVDRAEYLLSMVAPWFDTVVRQQR